MKQTPRLSIVLADDHALFRSGLRAIIQQQPGVEIIGEATDGHQALLMVEKLKPNILLLDIAMPGLNGIETLRRLRAQNTEVNSIVLSMYSDRQFVIEAFRAGARGYLLKDSALEELMEGIRTVGAGGVFLSGHVAGVVVDDYISLAGATATAKDELTGREREILQAIAEGKSTKEIAANLCLSSKTIESHRKHIMEKLKLFSIAELTRYAIRAKIISGE